MQPLQHHQGSAGDPRTCRRMRDLTGNMPSGRRRRADDRGAGSHRCATVVNNWRKFVGTELYIGRFAWNLDAINVNTIEGRSEWG